MEHLFVALIWILAKGLVLAAHVVASEAHGRQTNVRLIPEILGEVRFGHISRPVRESVDSLRYPEAEAVADNHYQKQQDYRFAFDKYPQAKAVADEFQHKEYRRWPTKGQILLETPSPNLDPKEAILKNEKSPFQEVSKTRSTTQVPSSGQRVATLREATSGKGSGDTATNVGQPISAGSGDPSDLKKRHFRGNRSMTPPSSGLDKTKPRPFGSKRPLITSRRSVWSDMVINQDDEHSTEEHYDYDYEEDGTITIDDTGLGRELSPKAGTNEINKGLSKRTNEINKDLSEEYTSVVDSYSYEVYEENQNSADTSTTGSSQANATAENKEDEYDPVEETIEYDGALEPDLNTNQFNHDKDAKPAEKPETNTELPGVREAPRPENQPERKEKRPLFSTTFPGGNCACLQNTIIEEGYFPVTCAEECQKKCQESCCCQFFIYNVADKSCGIRNWTPGGRSFSIGRISGRRDETGWKEVPNSAYAGKVLSTSSCQACHLTCAADNDCQVMTFNEMLGECSLNYGEGPFLETELSARYTCMGIASAYKECEGQNRTALFML